MILKLDKSAVETILTMLELNREAVESGSLSQPLKEFQLIKLDNIIEAIKQQTEKQK